MAGFARTVSCWDKTARQQPSSSDSRPDSLRTAAVGNAEVAAFDAAAAGRARPAALGKTSESDELVDWAAGSEFQADG